MTTSLLRPHAVAGIIGGRNSPLPLAKNKNHTVGLRRKSAIPAKKIRDLKLRRGARVAVAAASASGDDERIGSNVASRIATNIATAASTMLAAAYPALAEAVTTSTDVLIDDVSAVSFFDSLLLHSDNLLHGALGVAALSTTYTVASTSGSMSPTVNSASEELREERKTTAALRRHVETERNTAEELRSQLAEKEANAVEIKGMLKAAEEEKQRLSLELADAKRELGDVQLKLKVAVDDVDGNKASGDDKISESDDEERRLLADVTRLKKSLEQQDTLTLNLEKVAEETKVYAADLEMKLENAMEAADAAEARAVAAEKEMGKLNEALETAKQSLVDLKADLASQEQTVVEVNAAMEDGKQREIEMMWQLQEAAQAEAATEAELTATKQKLSDVQHTLAKQKQKDEEVTEVEALEKQETMERERQLLTEVFHLEEALSQQNALVAQQGVVLQSSKAEEASLKQQLQVVTKEKVKLKKSLGKTQKLLADVKAQLEAEQMVHAAQGKVDAAAEEIAAMAKEVMREADELKDRLAATEEEKSQLTALLEAAQKKLEETEEALANQERLLVSVGKAAEARKVREEEMTHLLKNATEEKIRLAADTAHLEASLLQQTTIAQNLGKMVAGSESAAADLKKQISDNMVQGERSSELVTELEAQLVEQVSRVEELQAQLAEMEKSGAKDNDGGKAAREEDIVRTQQLADQLNATQLTAAELSKELEKTKCAAGDAMAQRQLVELQLKTAEEKIAKVLAAKEQSEMSFELAVHDKSAKINQLNGEIDSLHSTIDELMDQLAEVKSKLELEKAGSLAAAKKNAMAMLDSYDVSQMMQNASDGASMAEAMAAAGAGMGGNALAEEFEFETAGVTTEGEWLQAYDADREIHYWYNNITMEVVWELPEGAQVHQSVSGPNDLPKHFEGPSGLNSR